MKGRYILIPFGVDLEKSADDIKEDGITEEERFRMLVHLAIEHLCTEMPDDFAWAPEHVVVGETRPEVDALLDPYGDTEWAGDAEHTWTTPWPNYQIVLDTSNGIRERVEQILKDEFEVREQETTARLLEMKRQFRAAEAV